MVRLEELEICIFGKRILRLRRGVFSERALSSVMLMVVMLVLLALYGPDRLVSAAKASSPKANGTLLEYSEEVKTNDGSAH